MVGHRLHGLIRAKRGRKPGVIPSLPPMARSAPVDAAALVAAVSSAAATDWRAAAWLLQHHPATESQYGERARQERYRAAFITRLIDAIAAADLPGDADQRLLIQLQAHGLGPR